MINVRLIAELGSCHMGKLERIQEAILRCKAAGIDALKLQLFPNEEKYTAVGNIYLPPEMFKLAFDYGKMLGVCVSASVFDYDSFCFLRDLRPDFIKFSYGKKNETAWIEETLDLGIEAIVSCDVMTDHLVDNRCTKLYCIVQYPVQFEVAFDELFPRFDGFSDHTLGIRQTVNAIDMGARTIEKHVRLGYSDEICPDASFAIKIEELGSLRA